MRVEVLRRPLSIGDIRDGRIYSLRLEPLTQTGLFLKVGRVDDVFVKMPSRQGLEDYRKYAKQAQTTCADIRSLEDDEKFERLDPVLERFSDFAQLRAAGREVLHYVAIHRIQYERLRVHAAGCVPTTRFALLRSGRLLRKLEPIFFQEHVLGTTLWDMFDFSALEVKPQWLPCLPAICSQLALLLDSPLLTHIDWNIKNFVFRETDRRLFYVDLKPTTFVAVQSNEHNLNGIRQYFVG